jgi:hypothetical protein
MANAVVCTPLLLLHACAMAYLSLVLLGGGVVPLRHVVFATCVVLYAALVNLVAPVCAGKCSGPLVPSRSRLIRLMFPLTAVLSFAGPWQQLLAHPTVLGPVLAPHLFLMHAQLATETVAHLAASRITVVVRLSVPIAHVAYRLPVIIDWWADAAAGGDATVVARILALVNGGYWSWALFGFMLPVVVPRFFSVPEQDFGRSERDVDDVDDGVTSSVGPRSGVTSTHLRSNVNADVRRRTCDVAE